MGQRTFDEHVTLFAAYAEAVAALPATAWHRLAFACASFEGDSFGALVRRARLDAKAHNIIEPLAEHSRQLRGIAAVTTATITGIGVAAQLIGEFDRRGSPSSIRPSRSATDPKYHKFVDAWFLLESAVDPIQTSHPGVAAVVRAAGQAVLRHDWLSPKGFVAVYGIVESEIPFATLEYDAR